MDYKNFKSLYQKIFRNERTYKYDFNKLHICKRVLDIGCGFGYFISNNPEKIFGIDYNPEAISQCISKKYKIVRGSALELPFKSESFDGVHCAHLIEHFNTLDVHKIIIESTRVLKKGGILIIRTPMPNKHFYDDPSHVKPYPPNAIMSMLNLTVDSQETFVMHQNYCYEFIDIIFKNRVLFQPLFGIAVRPKRYPIRSILKALGLLLSKIGIRHWQKGDHAIVAKKIA